MSYITDEVEEELLSIIETARKLPCTGKLRAFFISIANDASLILDLVRAKGLVPGVITDIVALNKDLENGKAYLAELYYRLRIN